MSVIPRRYLLVQAQRPLSVHRACVARNVSTASSKPERPYGHPRLKLVVACGAAGLSLAAYFFFPRESRAAPTRIEQLSLSHFTPVILTSSENSGPNTKLLTVSIPPHLLPSPSSCDLDPIWSIYIKDDDIQVERPYTPLEGIDEHGHMSFWIKKYAKGEVGRWLHSKHVGDTIEIRGPIKTWIWKDDAWDEIVMISGGTGITPFYQLLNNILNRASSSWNSKTRFTLLHSSRIPSELPPHSMLRTLAHLAERQPDRFKMHLFVDSKDWFTNASDQKLQVGRIGKSAIMRSLGLDASGSWWQRLCKRTGTSDSAQLDRKVLFLVCGPDQMIAAIAGPYGRNLSQGEVGGVLGELGYTSSQEMAELQRMVMPEIYGVERPFYTIDTKDWHKMLSIRFPT